MAQKIKDLLEELFKEIGLETTKNLGVAVLWGIITWFALGIVAIFTPFVPIDLQQWENAFLLVFFLVLSILLIVFIFLMKKNLHRFVCVFFAVLAFLAFVVIYQFQILNGINFIPGPKIILFYPEEFDSPEMKFEWEKAEAEISKSLFIEGVPIRLLQWPSSFPGDVEKTAVGRKLQRDPDVMGYIEMIEEDTELLLLLNLPALNLYRDLGASVLKTKKNSSALEKSFRFTVGFNAIEMQFGTELSTFGPHLGHQELNLEPGISISEDDYKDVNLYQVLPVSDIMRIPRGSFSRGLYFAANMLAAGYFNLSGYPDAFCEILENFIQWDETAPVFDMLSYVAPLDAVDCLYGKGPDYIDRLISGHDQETRESILQVVLSHILHSDEYDDLYLESKLFPPDTVSDLIRIRDTCGLANPEVSVFSQIGFLMETLYHYQYAAHSNPLLWGALSSKLSALQSIGFSQIMLSQPPDVIDRYVARWLQGNRLFSKDSRADEAVWIMYAYMIASTYLPALINDPMAWEVYLDHFIFRIRNIAAATGTTEITFLGSNLLDFFEDDVLLDSIKNDGNKIAASIKNNQSIRNVLFGFIPIARNFTEEGSEIDQILDNPDLYFTPEVIGEFSRYLNNQIAILMSPEMARGIGKTIHLFFEKQSLEELLDSNILTIADEMGELDASPRDLSRIISLFLPDKKLIDPLSAEFRAILSFIMKSGTDSPFSIHEPAIAKNPVHTSLLYYSMTQNIEDSNDLSRQLSMMMTEYPKEREALLFRHLKLVEAYQNGNHIQSGRHARDIIEGLDSIQRPFYCFFLESLRVLEGQNEDISEILPTSTPLWVEPFIQTERILVLEHFLYNRTMTELWDEAVGKIPFYQNGRDETYGFAYFCNILALYLEEYTRYADLKGEELKEMEPYLDPPLLSALSLAVNG